MVNLEQIREAYLNLLDLNEREQNREEVIQWFLEEYPILLPLLNPYQNIIFRKLKIGDKACDFAFARENSLGLKWHFIKLAKPWDRQYSEEKYPNGQLIASSELIEGIEQIFVWKSWFTRNIRRVQNTFPFRDKALELGIDEPHFTLIIGRRNNSYETSMERFREYYIKKQIDIISFDRLADTAQLLLNDKSAPELKICTIQDKKEIVLSTMKL